MAVGFHIAYGPFGPTRRPLVGHGACVTSWSGQQRPAPPDVPPYPAGGAACGCSGPAAGVPGTPEEESVARRGQRQPVARRTGARNPRGCAHEEGIIPVLARAVREVEAAVQRGPVMPSVRTKFQVIALLVREERAHVKADADSTEAHRAEQLKRLDGIATILAKTAARDTSLLALLTEDAVVSDAARLLKREMLEAAGMEAPPEEVRPPEVAVTAPGSDRRVVPQSVVSRQLANPFLVPDYSFAERVARPRRLASWELLGPLLRSFETAANGAPACMPLPEPGSLQAPGGLRLMPHQAQVVAAAASGHRTFLLADEPGLGKTAQALLAAQAAQAYPLLVVVPNVVKTNWAREANLWTPKRPATVIHGNGDNVDAFADIVIVNYEVLDRHVGWLGELGFRGMVVDEAHFIKNKSSQRSQHVLHLSDRIQDRAMRPLLMALTGTPLINDIEDFLAIWEFLGWIDDKEPSRELVHRLEEDGHTPMDPGFYPAARRTVIAIGIVRRRKVDVAADIPARRVADVPVELDGTAAKSVIEAEQRLVRRLVKRYESAVAARKDSSEFVGIDLGIVRQVCSRELREANDDSDGENVFSMMRRIGQAKAELAADYTAQLSRNAGKVVFFAKHIDVMDTAEDVFKRRGIGYTSIRGDQTPKGRQKSVDSFVNDPGVHIAVCSLLAAGVGINLQVSSNVVLAELSWTAAEQTQAIDRVHRIGQDQPVTAWRMIAAQTIDSRIAELVDQKAGLAARALDGSDEEISSSVDVQLETLVGLLTDALNNPLTLA